MNKISLIRLKSANFNCYVRPNLYRDELIHLMSTGDYNTHKAVSIEVTPQAFNDLCFNDNGHQVLLKEHERYHFYDKDGDCYISEVL